MNISDAFQPITMTIDDNSGRIVGNQTRGEKCHIGPISYKEIVESMKKEIHPEKNEEIDPLTMDSAKVVKRYKELRAEVESLRSQLLKRADKVEKFQAMEKDILNSTNKYLNFHTKIIFADDADEFEPFEKDFSQKVQNSLQAIQLESNRLLSAYSVKTNSLTEKLDSATKSLASLSELILISVTSSLSEEERSRVTSGKACPICIDKDVDMALDCGHVLCSKCLKNLKGNKCFMCRKVCVKPIKLYLNLEDSVSAGEAVAVEATDTQQNTFGDLYSNYNL